MTRYNLASLYRNYIECLNSRALNDLGEFVDENVEYNEKRISLSGYREMLENDYKAIPDLKFNIDILCSEPPMIASRLKFDCTPIGMLFGIPVNGKRVTFSENVFYEFHERRIIKVWSLIDYREIARQIGAT